jgi:glutaredoxin-like YruB-family protein
MSKPKEQQITVFSTPTCTYCTAAKRYLDALGISFTDIDVSRDRAAGLDMIRRSGQLGVPVIDIDGKIVVGFDRKLIDQYLNMN